MKTEDISYRVITFLDFSYNTAARKRLFLYSKMFDDQGKKLIFHSFYNGTFDNTDFSSFQTSSKSRSIRSILKFLSATRKEISGSKKVKVIIYPTSFYPFDIIAILFLKFSRKIDLYIELNEVRKYTIRIEKNRFNIKLLISYINTSILDFFFKLAKGHIYISNTIAGYYKKKKHIVIPILGAPESHIQVENQLTEFRQSEIFYIGFAGSIDFNKEKMEHLFFAIDKLNKNGFSIKLNVYGEILNLPSFEEKLKGIDFNLDQVQVKGNISQEKLNSRLSTENHLLVFPRGFSKQNYYGFGTKLSNYLESQVPILTSVIGDMQLYFKDKENCFIYEPKESGSLESKLIYIIENYNDVRAKIVSGGNDLMRNSFDYTLYSSKFVNFVSHD